jgi:hypothetical protein
MGMSQTDELFREIEKGRIEEAHLFSNFEKYYRKKDTVKASEFIWGSIAKIAYLIGLLFDQKLGRHGQLVAFLKNLARQQSRTEIVDWINAAESFHSNFYHNWMEMEVFEEYILKVVSLRIWLLEILERKLDEAYPIRTSP